MHSNSRYLKKQQTVSFLKVIVAFKMEMCSSRCSLLLSGIVRVNNDQNCSVYVTIMLIIVILIFF